VWHALPQADVRRALNGLAMGLTAMVLIYSPWGRRSGAHLNPAVTLTFWRLGKVPMWDALFYSSAQLLGGTLGVVIARVALGPALAHPAVAYVATTPGAAGVLAAFTGEFLISCAMMLMILSTGKVPRLARFTGVFAGGLLVLFITFEAPLSGMSLNPARSLASAIPSGMWTAEWIYLTAPILGMLAAVEVSRIGKGLRGFGCAKLHHGASQRCILCGWPGKKSPSATHASVKTPLPQST
jgi:aquaporin Z